MITEPRGGVLVLAAGLGTRFGADKRRHVMPDGRTLLDTTIDRHCEVFDQVRIVLRHDEMDLAVALRRERSLRITLAKHWQDGMGASLAAGIADCEGWDYAFVALGDMPWVTMHTLKELRASMEDHLCLSDDPIALRPTHEDVPGHPVGFTHHCFGALSKLTGDAGARELMRGAAIVEDLPVPDPGVILDVDTREALG